MKKKKRAVLIKGSSSSSYYESKKMIRGSKRSFLFEFVGHLKVGNCNIVAVGIVGCRKFRSRAGVKRK